MSWTVKEIRVSSRFKGRLHQAFVVLSCPERIGSAKANGSSSREAIQVAVEKIMGMQVVVTHALVVDEGGLSTAEVVVESQNAIYSGKGVHADASFAAGLAFVQAMNRVLNPQESLVAQVR